MVMDSGSNPRTQEEDAGGSVVQGHLWLYMVNLRPAWATRTLLEQNKTK